MATIAERRSAFRRLHEAGCFVIPNPWDAGSARALEHLGFKALATTSAGAAFSLAAADGAVARDAMLAHVRAIVEATDLPVNADYEGGYAHAPEQVAENVRLCVETGVAGLSIEDNSRDPSRPLYDLPLAVERIRAARDAIGGSGALLTARAECFLVGRTDLDETIRRLRAYSEAGADCLYAPGLHTREQVEEVVKAVAPKPVNFLALGAVPLTLAELAALGVRRISVGSALARVAWGAFLRAARAIADEGRFDLLAEGEPFAAMQKRFQA
jgi:2-methylisocitrate lyase-like PEP mutase family enzyme